MNSPIEVEPTLHKSHGPCPHCGKDAQSVWGWVHRGAGTRAIYYVRWTAGRPQDGMVWLVCVGRWDDRGVATERRSVGLQTRIVRGRPQFMVIDAVDTPWGCQRPATFGAHLTRAEVVDTPLAVEVFDYVDRILLHDPRVARFVATGEGMDGEGRPVAGRSWQSWFNVFRRAT